MLNHQHHQPLTIITHKQLKPKLKPHIITHPVMHLHQLLHITHLVILHQPPNTHPAIIPHQLMIHIIITVEKMKSHFQEAQENVNVIGKMDSQC